MSRPGLLKNFMGNEIKEMEILCLSLITANQMTYLILNNL
jgi:hypothetical protein